MFYSRNSGRLQFSCTNLWPGTRRPDIYTSGLKLNMKILFVVNPKAGGTDHSDTLEALRKLASDRGFDASFCFTTGKGDERRIRKEIETLRPERVIVGGGDGTLQQVAKILLPYQISMGILPLGSANGLATALSIPKDPILAVENVLNSTEAKPMDVLKLNGRHLCVHLSDIGANALLVKKYEEGGERGLLGYAKHLLTAVQETPTYKINVRTEKESIRKEGCMMAFANAHKYGTGVQISEGSVSDGMFEICNVEKISLDEVVRAGLTALQVFVDRDMFSDVITCREAEINLDKKAHFQIDGEYMGMTDRIKIEIIPGALKLLV